MKRRYYSVYDKVSCVFDRLWNAMNDADAKRAFIAGNKDNPHVGDHELYYIAEFDDNNGEVSITMPTRIYTGLDAKLHYTSEVIEEEGA